MVDENDVDVIRTRAAVTTTLTLTTDYTVSIDPADGLATITPTGSIVAADTWRLKGNIVAERTNDYQQRAGWQADEINQDFDRIWMAIQEFARDLAAASVAPQTLPLSLGNGGTGASYASVAALFAAIKQAATTAATGVVELASNAEALAATDATRALTPSNLAGLSGTYTPTLTSVTNVAASTASVCQYVRVGNVVTVSGKFDIDCTAAAGAATELGISLPIASNIAGTNDCCGVANATLVFMTGGIVGDATNNRASFQMACQDSANRAMAFTFTYLIT